MPNTKIPTNIPFSIMLSNPKTLLATLMLLVFIKTVTSNFSRPMSNSGVTVSQYVSESDPLTPFFSQPMWDSGITVSSLSVSERNPMTLFFLTLLVLALILFLLNSYLSKPPPIYLVDFSCFKPPSFCRVPFSTFLEHGSMVGFDNESIEFMSKILVSSGMSQETHLPPALHYIPPKNNNLESIKEAEMILFSTIDDLLSKTNTFSNEIGILIVNCSGFCPSPSLSSIIINKFKMRSDVKSFNLSGMGCSAGAIAVDLARNLLKTRKNCYAVVVSTEILSTGWYSGKEKEMLVLNCSFRMGGAATLLTNKKEAKNSAKYKLVYSLRTQRVFDDKAYYSAYREEDSAGKLGVTIKRDLIQATGDTLRSHVSIFSHKILPITEKIKYVFVIVKNKLMGHSEKDHVPNFKSVIQHFCLPASGRPLMKKLGKGLGIGERDMEAALMTLHRFGNQSSSQLLYELAYLEAKERVKKGDKVWVMGMGTGHKCQSLVWECLRPIVGEASKGPWANCIDEFPKEF